MGPPCWENTAQQSKKGPASPVEVKATLRPNSIWQTVPNRNQWEAGQWVVILCLFAQENNSSWTEKLFYKKLTAPFGIGLSIVASYIFVSVNKLCGTIYTQFCFGQATLIVALIMFPEMRSFKGLLLPSWLGTRCITVIHFQSALHSLLHVTTMSLGVWEEKKSS